MTLQPNYGLQEIEALSERVGYELWLLEGIYSLVEQELFPAWPDAVVYPLGDKTAQVTGYGRGNITLGDWRPGFLNAGAPLVFVASFKILDMFVEWVIDVNVGKVPYQFERKLAILAAGLTFPPLIESHPWLKDRLIGLYRTIEPLRGTIIHNQHFSTTNGTLLVAYSKKGIVGSTVTVEPDRLRGLARTLISVLRYVEGVWNLDNMRFRVLRHELDELSYLHGMPLLGQKQPYHVNVRVYLMASDPILVNLAKIRSDLAQRYPDQDCSFDLRVVKVENGQAVGAYLFLWPLISSGDFDWARIQAEDYRTEMPTDVKPEHIRGAAS